MKNKQESLETDLLNSHPLQALIEKSPVQSPDATVESTAQHQGSGGESFKLLETTASLNSVVLMTDELGFATTRTDEHVIGAESRGREQGLVLEPGNLD